MKTAETNNLSKKKLHLFVITHCESCYNKRGIFTGRIDSKLTPKGYRFTKKIAERLKNEKIDVAYSSSLSRSKQTLKYIMKYHPKTKVVIDDRIIERDYGELSRKSKKKYEKEHPDLYPIYHRSYEIPPPGGESIKQVEKRVLPFIRDVIKLMKEKKINVLVVTHGNSIRPIRRYFEHLTPEEMMKLENYRHKIFRYKVSANK